MPIKGDALQDLTSRHPSVLVLDAASARIQAGFLEHGRPARWTGEGTGAGVALFRAVQRLGVAPESVGAFVFCEGPGSILGIRTAAMAIRTWCALAERPIYAYNSLELVGRADGSEAGVIADARRGLWHHWAPATGLRRLGAAAIPEGVATPDGFRHWAPHPVATRSVPYDVGALFERLADSAVIRPCAAPEALMYDAPAYLEWTPRMHGAGGAIRR